MDVGEKLMKITNKIIARRFATTSEIATRTLAIIGGFILLIVPMVVYNHYKPVTFINEHGYTTIEPSVLSNSVLNFLDWFSFFGVIVGLILIFWGLYFFCEWAACVLMLYEQGFFIEEDVIEEIKEPFIKLKHNNCAYVGTKAKKFHINQSVWAVNSANCLLVFDKDNYDK